MITKDRYKILILIFYLRSFIVKFIIFIFDCNLVKQQNRILHYKCSNLIIVIRLRTYDNKM